MKSFDEIAAKKANGGTLTPLETISLEGPCIDNQKRLNAFNRAIDTADQDLQALTATISEQGARIAELEEELKTSNERQQHYRDKTETLADEIETLNDDIDGLLLGDES